VFVPDTALRNASNNINVSGINFLHLVLTEPTQSLTVGSGANVGLATSGAGSLANLTIDLGGTATLMQRVTLSGTATINGTLTANPFDNIGAGSAWLNLPSASNGHLEIFTNAMTIGSSGLIHMDDKGYAGGTYNYCQGGSTPGRGLTSGYGTNANEGGGSCADIGSGHGGSGGSYGTQGTAGSSTTLTGTAGATYGSDVSATNLYLGSGGGASRFREHHRGGIGGGAILIDSATAITVSGSNKIRSLGGHGGTTGGLGGGGSGGTVVLDAPSAACTSVSVAGGAKGNSSLNNATNPNYTGTGGAGRCLAIP
jgi:hypothetical protein